MIGKEGITFYRELSSIMEQNAYMNCVSLYMSVIMNVIGKCFNKAQTGE